MILQTPNQIRSRRDYARLKANLARIGPVRTIRTHMGPEILAHLADASEDVADDGRTIGI